MGSGGHNTVRTSLISKMSTSSTSSPAFFSATGMASAGPIPINPGGTPGRCKPLLKRGVERWIKRSVLREADRSAMCDRASFLQLTNHRIAAEAAQDLIGHPERLGFGPGHQQHRGRTVRDAARVAGRGRAVLLNRPPGVRAAAVGTSTTHSPGPSRISGLPTDLPCCKPGGRGGQRKGEGGTWDPLVPCPFCHNLPRLSPRDLCRMLHNFEGETLDDSSDTR